MVVISAALHCEASPIIKHYSLKRDDSCSAFEIFSNGEITLIVSRIGRVRSAAAISYALAKVQSLRNCAVFNIGICGASPEIPIGELVLPNKISCAHSRRTFYPDILVRHIFREVQLKSHDSPQFETALFSNECVDMEAHGFFEGASIFLSSSQIYTLKIVSDHLDQAKLEPGAISKLVESNIDKLDIFMRSMSGLQERLVSPLDAGDEDFLKKLSRELRLSRYQVFSLMKLAASYKIRSGQDLTILNEFCSTKPQSKNDVKNVFSRIENVLTTI